MQNYHVHPNKNKNSIGMIFRNTQNLILLQIHTSTLCMVYNAVIFFPSKTNSYFLLTESSKRPPNREQPTASQKDVSLEKH